MTSRKASKHHEVCVWSFAPEPQQRIHVQHYQDKILVKELLTAVAQALGIDNDNIQYFAIFEGSLLNPSRKLNANDLLHLPCQKSHSIQKWSFDVEKERKVIKSDMAALKLFRCQALSDIREGKLRPTTEEAEKLDDVGSFVLDHQFMSIIYSLKDYGAVITENCQVINELTLPHVRLDKRECITLKLDLKNLTVNTGNAWCVIPWERIHMVSSSGDTVEYEVYVQPQLIKWLRISTCQADYVKEVTSEIWKVIKERHEKQPIITAGNNYQPKTKHPYHSSNFDKI